MEISVHHAAFLERKSILDEDIAVNLSPKVDVGADNITLYNSRLTEDNTALRGHFALESTVDADVVWRDDLTLDDSACRNTAD